MYFFPEYDKLNLKDLREFKKALKIKPEMQEALFGLFKESAPMEVSPKGIS